MLNERLGAARDVSDRLLAFERAIDEALARGGELATAMPAARLKANLSAVQGQTAFDAAFAALTSVATARGQLVQSHGHFADLKKQMGLAEFAVGDSEKGPSGALLGAEGERLRVVG